MSNAIVRIVRREIDASKNRTGMQAGLRKVIIDTSHAEYLCKLAERELRAENERLRKISGNEILKALRESGLYLCRPNTRDHGCLVAIDQTKVAELLDKALATKPGESDE